MTGEQEKSEINRHIDLPKDIQCPKCFKILSSYLYTQWLKCSVNFMLFTVLNAKKSYYSILATNDNNFFFPIHNNVIWSLEIEHLTTHFKQALIFRF